MAGPYREIQVHLHRDALNTPWGFRLQGGKDFKTALTVQRVFVGSPADGELHRGDIIIGIENYDSSQMIHKQAQDLIKSSGGSLNLFVKRGFPARSISSQSSSPHIPGQAPPSGFRSRPLETGISYQPKPPSVASSGPNFGIDYSQSSLGRMNNPGSMLNRVHHSLDNALWQPGGDQIQGDIDYEQRSVQDIKQMFTPKGRYPASYSQNQPSPRRGWKKPDPVVSGGVVPGGLREPGWTAQPRDTPSWSHVSAPGGVPAAQRRPPEQQYQPSQLPPSRPMSHQVPHIDDGGTPAWAGTLKGSGGPKPWELQAAAAITGQLPPVQHATSHSTPVNQPIAGPSPGESQVHAPRVQNVHYAPGQGPVYQQKEDQDASNSARVVHLQYNSPLSLYSKDNVQEALEGQTADKPGAGTLLVTGGNQKQKEVAYSDTWRLVHEQDARRMAHTQPQYQQHQQHQQQDPARTRNVETSSHGGHVNDAIGASDF